MCRGNLRDDGKAEANTTIAPGLETPEDFIAFVLRHARAAIAHAQCGRPADHHFDVAARGRVCDRIVQQIFDRQHERGIIARNRFDQIGVDQAEFDVARDRQRCAAGYRFRGRGAQIDSGRDIERRTVQSRHGQHLLEQPPHPVAIRAQRDAPLSFGKFIDASREYRQWRPQRVCGITDETAMRRE